MFDPAFGESSEGDRASLEHLCDQLCRARISLYFMAALANPSSDQLLLLAISYIYFQAFRVSIPRQYVETIRFLAGKMVSPIYQDYQAHKLIVQFRWYIPTAIY